MQGEPEVAHKETTMYFLFLWVGLLGVLLLSWALPFILCIGIIVIMGVLVSLPVVLGLVFRLTLKRANGKIITVFAGAIIFFLNAKLMPWDKLATTVTKVTHGKTAEIVLSMYAINSIIWIVSSFCFPCLLARIGVNVGERILRRRKPQPAAGDARLEDKAEPQR